MHGRVALALAAGLVLASCTTGARPSGTPLAPLTEEPVMPAAVVDETPSPSPTTTSREPMSPPGSIVTSDVREADGGYVARLRSWSVDGELLSAIEAPFTLSAGWWPGSSAAATPDGRLALYATRHPPGSPLRSAEAVVVLDMLDPPVAPLRILEDEWFPSWTTVGDLVTSSRDSSTGYGLYRLRQRGEGEPRELSETEPYVFSGVSDRHDGAPIVRDRTHTRWWIMTWDGELIPFDGPPEPALNTGIERVASPSGEQIYCEELDSEGRRCMPVLGIPHGTRYESGLVGERQTGWFDLAMTRRGDAAIATSRDRIRRLQLVDGALDIDVLARLPDAGSGRHWAIGASTDSHVVVVGQDGTGIVPLAGGEPVWIEGTPVGVIPG